MKTDGLHWEYPQARDISQTYTYDDIYQLVRAQGESPDKNKTSTYVQTFAYDSTGNILHKTSEHSLSPGNAHPKELNYDFSYLYNGTRPHAPTQIGNWKYEYDGNGNTIYKERITGNEAKGSGKESGQTDDDIEGGGTSGTYLWNEENRLIEAKVNGRSTYFLYNAGGERTVKRGQHGESLYVNTFYQLQNRSEVTKHVFVGTSRIVSKLSHFHDKNGLYDSGYEQKNIYFYHPDHLGSSNFITGPDGREFEHIEYTPYGETWVDEGTNKNVIGYRFTSKELDTETGLYYFGARYLDPTTSRWISPDPAFGDYLPVKPVGDEAKKHNQNLPGMGGVFNPVNLAVYHYAGNNPVKYVDPDGEIIEIGFLADLKSEDILEYINSKSFIQFELNAKNQIIPNYKKVNMKESTVYSDMLLQAIRDNNIITINQQEYWIPTNEGKPIKAFKIDDFAKGGLTIGNFGKDQQIFISGNSSNWSTLLENGELGDFTPSEILMHELIGHAIPKILELPNENAILLENVIRDELDLPKRKVEKNHMRY